MPVRRVRSKRRPAARYPGSVTPLFLILITLTLVAVLGVVVLVVVVAKGAQARQASLSAPRLRGEAMVVDKRTQISGGSDVRTSQRYFVTFQFPDGNRLELAVSGPESGMLTPGDRGILEWQGAQFAGFARQILR